MTPPAGAAEAPEYFPSRKPRGHVDPRFEYVQRLYGEEDALLKKVTADLVAKKGDLSFMQVAPEEGAMIGWFLRNLGVRTIIELGSLVGYSAIRMARALPDDGHVYCVEYSPEHAAMAEAHFAMSEVGHKISMHVGAALDMLPALEGEGPFDAIFIDADKGNYPAYLDWSEKHIRKGGVILIDNTLSANHFDYWRDTPPQDASGAEQWEAVRSVNERLIDAARYDSMMFPTREGLTVAVKRF